jgi:hypothetical protein
MRAKLGLVPAVLLLAIAAVLPQAAQAYEFDMVSAAAGEGDGGGAPSATYRWRSLAALALPSALLKAML